MIAKYIPWSKISYLLILCLLLSGTNMFSQSSCPDPDRYGIQCIGPCGTSGTNCIYEETFETNFTGNGKYVFISAFADGVQVHSQCLGPLPGSTTEYSVTFEAACDASIYVLYSAYTNSSSQNPCGGTVCAEGFCAYDTCQEGVYLPITLESFIAQQVDNEVHLTWITRSELQNDHFEIEKSRDGIIWQLIGQQRGLGNETDRQVYQMIDYAPYSGDNYYRLTQVDVDGTRNKHGVVVVRSYPSLLTYYHEGGFVRYSSSATEDLTLHIVNQYGQLIEQTIIAPGESIPLRNKLSTGIYFLKYVLNHQPLARKILIRN